MTSEKYTARYINLGNGYTFQTGPEESGDISVALNAGGTGDTLYGRYYYKDEDTFVIDFAVAPPAAVEGETLPVQYSYVTVSVKCYTAPGNPVTVNGETTTTTIIRWDDPVIQKGGA